MATYANTATSTGRKCAGRPRPHARLRSRFHKQAAYLATLKPGAGAWSYELKELPRVKGKGTRVVITEYDLPRKPLMPHDVIVDRTASCGPQFDQHSSADSIRRR